VAVYSSCAVAMASHFRAFPEAVRGLRDAVYY